MDFQKKKIENSHGIQTRIIMPNIAILCYIIYVYIVITVGFPQDIRRTHTTTVIVAPPPPRRCIVLLLHYVLTTG